MDELWAQSRAGSHAGRGFHYQDAVATELAVPAWRGELAALRLIPEGLEDVSPELPAHRLHLQAKSRRAHRGDFAGSELVDSWRHLAERLSRRLRPRRLLRLHVPGTRPAFARSTRAQ